MDYALLKDVSQESHRWQVRVRTTRFSQYIDENKPDRVIHLDLVFLDEQGTAMDLQIPERHLTQFTPLLKEDSVCYLEYFEVTDASQIYRPVDNILVAIFTAHTKIREIGPVPERFPTYACTLVSFDVLRSRSNDTIGIITTVSHIQTVAVKVIPKPIGNIHITDDRSVVCDLRPTISPRKHCYQMVHKCCPPGGSCPAEQLYHMRLNGPVTHRCKVRSSPLQSLESTILTCIIFWGKAMSSILLSKALLQSNHGGILDVLSARGRPLVKGRLIDALDVASQLWTHGRQSNPCCFP